MTSTWRPPSIGALFLGLLTASAVAVVVPLLLVCAALSRGFTDPGALFAMAFAPIGMPVAAVFALPLAVALRAGLPREPRPLWVALGGLSVAVAYLLAGALAARQHPGALLELLTYPASTAFLALPWTRIIERTPSAMFELWLARALLVGIPLGGFLAGWVLGLIAAPRRK